MAFSFAQLTSSMFLCTLDAAPISVGGNIRLCGKYWEMYHSEKTRRKKAFSLIIYFVESITKVPIHVRTIHIS
ncbi:hypothetical protein C8R41DRAFT_855874 [Lentinula lateritia]|uniref:Secreted protein n=1 Tax=Lentinula lateritia TaxID=40482 RepID=A0ABQ8V5U3_9AGAR|nr:hypothetical protein C8R41DRAFT_855874 [Lentinula lateritia]